MAIGYTKGQREGRSDETMSFYTGSMILAALLMIAMSLHVVTYPGFTKKQKTWFLMTFAAIMLCGAAEYAVHCGYYSASFALPLTILTVMQFSTAPLLAVLFAGALGDRRSRFALIYFALNLVIEAVSACFGWVFYFNEEGYFRGEWFLIYEALYFFSLLYLVRSMIVVGKNLGRRDIWTIVMILVILAAGILPMTFYHLNITYAAIAIAATLCYIYYNDLVQQDVKAELVSKQNRISEMQAHMISGLANLIESRDMDTGEHISRTSALVKALAEAARKDGVYAEELTDRFITLLYTLAPMHDIGKIIIPDSILKKPGKLTAEEFEQMKRHAAVGGTVVREILNGVADEEYLSFAADIATYHHERWDGTGYPTGLSGESIPLAARIMAVADVFDALISERCYKKAMPPEEAYRVIQEGAGSHFDPRIAAVFLNHKTEFTISE